MISFISLVHQTCSGAAVQGLTETNPGPALWEFKIGGGGLPGALGAQESGNENFIEVMKLGWVQRDLLRPGDALLLADGSHPLPTGLSPWSRAPHRHLAKSKVINQCTGSVQAGLEIHVPEEGVSLDLRGPFLLAAQPLLCIFGEQLQKESPMRTCRVGGLSSWPEA